MARALRGLVADDHDAQPRTMYDSDDQRDRASPLAVDDASKIRAHLLAGVTILRRPSTHAPDQWETRVERTPGSRAAGQRLPGMRWRELGSTTSTSTRATPRRVGLAFAEHLLDAMTRRLRPSSRSRSNRSTRTAPGSSGPASPRPGAGRDRSLADLAWWLTRATRAKHLSCSHGK
jgi:hypothetical protein